MRESIHGRRFGRLIVASAFHRNGELRQGCVCDCGKITSQTYSTLMNGSARSCGCLRDELAGDLVRTHGRSKTRTHGVWMSMRSRCNNPNNQAFPDYGGRGIKVCARWDESFEAWIADMGERPTDDHTIDRIDNDRGYEPGNCRWATQAEQNHNTRTNVRLTAFGITKTLSEWGVDPRARASIQTISRRIKAGWSDGLAIVTPSRERVSAGAGA